MFDGSYKDPIGSDSVDVSYASQSTGVPRASAAADPVGFLHSLEDRLIRSEAALQDQISRLSRRVDVLADDVKKLDGGSANDISEIERELILLADRLVRLEAKG